MAKTVDKIYQEMAEVFTGRTGLEAGAAGDLAVRLYAVAAQIHGLYLQAEWTRRQCFPQTAAGEYLDLHAALRGVERKRAAKAAGVLRFSVREAGMPRTIPAGTVCMTAGLVRFETTKAVVLAAGSTYADAPARALEPGAAGNTAAGTILTMAVAPAGVEACTNPEAFSGGADQEDDESLRARVLETYRRLANGANAAFYEQKALSFDGVAAATVLPRLRGAGTVDVVIATPSGTPGQGLLKEVGDYFEKTREIAVDVKVTAPARRMVDLSVQVRTAANREGSAVLEQVKAALRGWFNGTRLSRPVLRAELGSVIYGVDGVENYSIAAPAADLAGAAGVLPVLGTLTVEEMV